MEGNKLNIALIGYGKMGKIIEEVAQNRGHKIGLKISSSNRYEFNSENLSEIDVAIEFTTPKAAVSNLLLLAQNNIPTACGTTAWLDNYNEVCAAFTANKTGFLFASNFSIGVNLFFAINRHLALLMKDQSEYDIAITEAHHLTKKDAPSGTAVTLAEEIISRSNQKTDWTLNEDTPGSLKIEAIREKDVKGMHEIRYTSTIDEITIKHEAFSRKGFALGAVLAAEFIAHHPDIHTMSEVLNLPTI